MVILQLVYSKIYAARVRGIIVGALGEEAVGRSTFWKGLGVEDREIIAEGRKGMDDKTVGEWLDLFGLVCGMALGELAMDN